MRDFLSRLSLGRLITVLLLFSTVGLIQYLDRQAANIDPDRYFHLALSRIEAEQGTIHTLAQADDIGWNKNFTDKEYLFHVLTRTAYKIAGDNGVLCIPPFIVCCILGLLLLAAPGSAGFWTTVGLEILLFFLCPHFYNRMILLRPHLTAVLFFLGIILALVKRKPVAGFLSAMAFALAYHSYFLPLVALALAFPLVYLFADWKKPFLGAFLGLTLGILINPYFPETLQVMFLVLNEGIDPKYNQLLESGFELIPLEFSELMSYYWLHFGLLFGGLTVLVAGLKNKKLREPHFAATLYLGALAFFFGVSLSKSPRATEYFVPVLVAFCGSLTAHFKLDRKAVCYGLTALPLLGVSLTLLAWPEFKNVYSEIWQRISGSPITNELNWDHAPVILAGLKTLPNEAAGKKIFNCEWWSGSYILYARPDMKFVDLNTPEYLFLNQMEKALARIRLRISSADEIYNTVTHQFSSQYILCKNPRIVSILDQDLRYKRLYPLQSEPRPEYQKVVYLFQVF